MDAQTKRAIDALTQELLRTQAELATVKRGQRRPQLGNSSIDTGSLEVRDSAGVTRLRLGWQPDGSVGVVPEGGDPHPAPGAPTVEAIPSGLSVTWDGTLDGLEMLPADFDHINVHVSTTSGFTPTAATFAGTIPRSGGSLPVAPLEVGTTYYVRLVPVGTGGVQGAPSAQASGTPTGVTDIEPGSITEVEIADDAITSPKISANAIQALHIAAEQIEAGHIQAAAVTAAKLEADLVLGTRIIAGNPSGARVELDENGLRGYTGGDELAFVLDDQGNATFSGSITGSEITGSRMTITTPGGATGVIEGATGGVVRSRVTGANGSRAQLAGTPTQAEFSVFGDVTSATTPAGGMVAVPTFCQLSLYSDVSDSVTSPVLLLTAQSGEARVVARGGTGSDVRITAQSSWAGIFTTPEASTVGEPASGPGSIYAFRRSTSDAPTLSLQSPMSESGPGAGRRSIIHVEGANNGRAHTIINSSARQFYFQGELVDDVTDTTTPGQVQLAPTHSLLAPRMRPVTGALLAVPGGGTTAPGGGIYVDFTAGQWERPTFRTPASGRVRITINMAGVCGSTPSATFRVGFRIMEGSTTVLGGDTSRSAITQARASGDTNPKQMSITLAPITLTPETDHTLVPMWAISASAAGTWTSHNVAMSEGYENTITIEPVM